MVALSPVMFYIPIGGTSNLSAADLLMPLITLYILRRGKEDSGAATGIALWAWALLTAVSLSGLSAALLTVNFSHAAFLLALAKIAIGLLYAWAAAALLATSASSWQVFFWSWLLVAIALSIATILSAATGLPLVRLYAGGRYSGSFEDPNLFGTYLSISLAMALGVRGRYRSTVLASALLTIPLAIVLTGSRGALAAALLPSVIILLAAVRHMPKLLPWIAAGGAAVALSAIDVAAVMPRFMPSFARATEFELGSRSSIWGAAIDAWEASPVLGIGAGQFRYFSAYLFRTESGAVAHNTLLGMLAETGLIGLCIFLIPFILGSMRLALRGPGSREWTLLIAAVALAVGMMSLSLENARFTWILAGAIVALTSRSISDAKVASP